MKTGPTQPKPGTKGPLACDSIFPKVQEASPQAESGLVAARSCSGYRAFL